MDPMARDLLRGRLAFGVFAAEALDTTRCVNQFLLAGKERVASGADLGVDVSTMGGASDEAVSAGANDADFFVIGMNSCFRHDSFRTFPAIFLFYLRICGGARIG